MRPHHIEITSYDGASKWVRNVVSHTKEQLYKMWENGTRLMITDVEGGETALDLAETYMIRFQDNEVFHRKSKEINGHGRRRS